MKNSASTLVNTIVAIILLTSIFLVSASAFDPSFVTYNPSTNTYTVSPTGGDDTANIQDAFDAAVASGPGSTVQLTAGQFYTNNIVVEDFHGTFKGAGRSLTKIDVLRGLDPDAPGVTPRGKRRTGQVAALFVFEGGDFEVSDMGFEITPYAPAEPYIWHGIYNVDLYMVVMVTGSAANSRFDRLDFKGHFGTLDFTNIRVGIAVWGTPHDEFRGSTEFLFSEPFTGTHTIVNSHFDTVSLGISEWGLTDGALKIGGSASTGNTFVNLHTAIFTPDMENSFTEISYNDVRNVRWWGFQIVQLTAPRFSALPIKYISRPSQWLIAHNTIQSSIGTPDGIGLEDFSGLDSGIKSLDAVVTNNKITLDTIWGGIYGIAVHDAVVANNIISGTMLAGIYLSFYGEPSSGWTIEGNNVQNLNAVGPNPYVPWVPPAPIFLGWGSSHITVVGEAKDNVIDAGTDNILVGVNNMGRGAELGQDLKDAMQQKWEARQQARSIFEIAEVLGKQE